MCGSYIHLEITWLLRPIRNKQYWYLCPCSPAVH